MKIRKKDNIVFTNSISYSIYQYEKLTIEELRRFINKRIHYVDDNWFFDGEQICCYLTNVLKPLRHLFIQTMERECARLYYEEGKINIEICHFNNPMLKCYVIGKEK